jgi:hypothetical protein
MFCVDGIIKVGSVPDPFHNCLIPSVVSVVSKAVFRIRVILISSSKNIKKTLIPTVLRLLFDLLS